MRGNTNPNTRAVVSALRCDHKSLRAAAAQLVDWAIAKHPTHSAQGAVMLTFNASPRTADTILYERRRVTKSGARRE